jgi:sacsin
MIQNADDAGATVVKILVNHRHYQTASLLGPRMSEWQGPAIYVYNNAEFTARDFENLSRIGQASKLDKLATTGRFGLGFNAVYHFTGEWMDTVAAASHRATLSVVFVGRRSQFRDG